MLGYRKRFLSSPPEDLKCTHCQLIARDPYCSKCNCGPKLYCQMCIQQLKGQATTCPTCQQTLESFGDRLSAKHIRAIKVACDNEDEGCSWQGQLGELESHLNTCLLQTVNCSYSEFGCGVRVKREKEQQHIKESKETHLQLVVAKVQRLEAVTITPPVVFQLTGFTLKKTKNERWNSPRFYSHPGGYRFCLSIDANGNKEGKCSHVSVYVCLMKSPTDSHLPWPFRGEVTIEVLNQVKNSTHFAKSILFDWQESDIRNSRVTNQEATGRGWGFHNFIPHSLLGYNAASNTHYLKDDTLIIRVAKVTVYDSNKPWLTATITE